MLYVMSFCGALGAAAGLVLLLASGAVGWWARGVRDWVERERHTAPPRDPPLTEDQLRRNREEREAMERTMGYSVADAYGMRGDDAWPDEARPPGGR